MPKPVYRIGFVVGKQFVVMASALPSRLSSRELASPRAVPSVEETVMLLLRVPPELKPRLMTVATELGVTIQSIGRVALEIELQAREEMLIGGAEREEEIRRRVRSGEAHR